MLTMLMMMAGLAGDSGTIEAYLRDVIPLYRADGSEAGRKRSKELPRPLDFNGESEFGDLRVTINGTEYFIRRADVRFTGGRVTCAPSGAAGREANSRQGVSRPGTKAGAGSGTQECVRP